MSTRYVNLGHEGEITVIRPYFFAENTDEYKVWKGACHISETAYMDLIGLGRKPEEARLVLIASTATELVMTANLREWRHFLKLRTAKDAHPQIREVAIPLLTELKSLVPVVFDDLLENFSN
jgi:thymidylate synthase (FAD)